MSNILSLTLPLIALVIAAGALAGCGSGQQRSSKTIKATSMVPVDVTKAKQELDEVVRALKNVKDASDSADLKKIHSDLKSHAGKLTESLADVESSSDSAVAAGQSQMKQWQEQTSTFTDADLRNSSNKRVGELRKSVDALSTSSANFKPVSESYKSQLSQTIKALELDLSQQGIRSVKPVISRLVDDESNLRDALSDITTKSKAVNEVINP